MSSTLHIDPADFRDVIDQAVDSAVRRIRDERLTDEAGKILLDKKQAAQALSMSEASVDRLRQSGDLPFVKASAGKVYFRPEALAEWARNKEI